MRRLLTALGAVAAIGVGIVFWLSVRSYSPPPRTERVLALAKLESSIVLPVSASLDTLERLINESLPGTLFQIDENRDECVPAQWAEFCAIPKPWPLKGCIQHIKTKVTPAIDCHVSGSVSRGRVSLGGAGRSITVTMPVAATVTVRGRGDIGKHIQETATGAVTATAAIEVSIDNDWNPTAEVKADYSWDNRIGVDVLGFRITFASRVDPKIRDAIESLRSKLPGIIASVGMKQRIEELWAAAFATIKVLDKPEGWVRVSPNSVGYEGYNVANRTLNFAVSIDATTEALIGPRPEPTAATPLPRLRTDLVTPGFEFNIPAIGEYAALIDASKSALDVGTRREFDVEDVGRVGVTIKDVAVYQTVDDQLAIGIEVEADPPTGFFDVSGFVWFTGTMSVDNDRKRATVDKLTLYTSTDNAPVDLLVKLVQIKAINAALKEALKFDFSREYDGLLAQANAALRRQISEKVFIDGHLSGISVGAVRFDARAVVVDLTAHGVLRVGLGALPTRP